MPKIMRVMWSLKHGVAFFEVEGRTDWYIVEWDFFNDVWWCSCPGFMFRKRCSHVEYVKKWVVDNMPITVEDIISGRSEVRYFDSPIGVLNEMFDGPPFSSAVVFGLVAAYKAGKTLLSIEQAFYLASQGYKVLYIDTEGSSMTMFKKWAPIFKAKYNLDDASSIFVEDIRSLKSLMNYLGYTFQIYNKVGKPKDDEGLVTTKKGDGKSEVIMERFDDKGEIWHVINKYNIDFVILDSLSNPFRPIFSNRQQDNPAKSRVEAAIIQKLIELQKEFNVGVLVTLQASWNPADSYASITQVRARGGFGVYYNIKRMVFMNARDKTGFRSYRKIWLVRGEDKEEWSEVGVVKITDAGYTDVPVEEWQNVFTTSELKLVNIGEWGKKKSYKKKRSNEDVVGLLDAIGDGDDE